MVSDNGFILGPVSAMLAQHYEQTWIRLCADSGRTIYVSPDLGPITEPSYVKVLVVPGPVVIAESLSQQWPRRGMPAWLSNYPSTSAVAEPESASPPAWWDSSNGDGHGVANSDVNSISPQDECTKVDIDRDDDGQEDTPAPSADEPLDLASFKLGDIQIRILRWLYRRTESTADEIEWNPAYKRQDNASRRVVFSRALKNLERKGLIERVKHKDQPHSRTRAVRLTPLGLRVAKMIAAAEA